tara:strand:- start:743 stop:1153 length:411 start_codon:yes stop_codon:yes gene_type:complete
MAKKTDATKPAGTKSNGKIAKKSKANQVAPPEFASYIAKIHKAQQTASGEARTISKDSVMALEGLADHVIHLLVENGKRVSRFTKSTTFKIDEAKAATTLTLTGPLRERAMKAGQSAYDKYKATLPAKTPKKAPEA